MARKPQVSNWILQTLEKHHVLSAIDIIACIQKEQKNVNKTTVYRAIDKLLEDGKICRQVFGNDILMYELRHGDHHDHLVCESCGTVEAIPCQTMKKKNIDGFVVNHHHTTLFGTCKNCC